MVVWVFVRRVAVKFANLDVEFVDREVGLGQVETWAERGGLCFPWLSSARRVAASLLF